MSDLLICPKCGSDKIARERRIDGYTTCNSCGHKDKSENWDNQFIHSYKDNVADDFRKIIAWCSGKEYDEAVSEYYKHKEEFPEMHE